MSYTGIKGTFLSFHPCKNPQESDGEYVSLNIKGGEKKRVFFFTFFIFCVKDYSSLLKIKGVIYVLWVSIKLLM